MCIRVLNVGSVKNDDEFCRVHNEFILNSFRFAFLQLCICYVRFLYSLLIPVSTDKITLLKYYVQLGKVSTYVCVTS